MRIGIDISQLAYSGTGVASYLQNLIEHLVQNDVGNEYILFFSSLRKKLPQSLLWRDDGIMSKITLENFPMSRVKSIFIKKFLFPQTLLDFVWNKLHIIPIELLIGPVDVFISSDWTQPPSKAKKMTILYDLVIYKYPNETAEKILQVQQRKLRWVMKEVDKIICISEATKEDAMKILKIPEDRLEVIYPGL